MAKVSTTKTQPTQVSTHMHRELEGIVATAPGQKTISVLVKRMAMHAKYRKQYAVSRKYAVHDEENTAKVGDTVRIRECRPLSKNKRWLLVSVIKQAA